MTDPKRDVLEDLNVPQRRPWIIVLLLLAVVVLGIWLARRREAPPAPAAASDSRSAAVAASAPAPVPKGPDSKTAPPVVKPTSAAATTKSVPPPSAAVTVAAAGPTATNSVAQLLAEARDLDARDAWVDAREKLVRALTQAVDQKTIADIEGRIGDLGIRLILTPRPMPGRIFHVVQAGDSVDKIAKQYGTTVDLITVSNQLKAPDLIKAGDRLAVYTGRFSIVVNKSSNDLLLLENQRFFKRYRVGTGKHGRTPPGTFEVADKQKEPVWWRPDGKEIPYRNPENILGTRWLSIKATGNTPDVKGYGIHGTWDENSLGKAESAGCVRMRNKDVEELYVIVPFHTPVTIVE